MTTKPNITPTETLIKNDEGAGFAKPAVAAPTAPKPSPSF